MSPPECAVCGVDVDPSSPRRRFGPTPPVLPPDAWGAPASPALPAPGVRRDDAVWRCPTHDAALAAVRHLPWPEALASLRERKPHPSAPPPRRRPEPEPSGAVQLAERRAVLGLARALAAALPDLVGGGEAPAVRSRKQWTPMDRVEPPWCPWVDHLSATLAGSAGEASVSASLACFSEDAIGTASVRVSLDGPGGRGFVIGSANGSPAVNALWVFDGPRSALLADWVARVTGGRHVSGGSSAPTT